MGGDDADFDSAESPEFVGISDNSADGVPEATPASTFLLAHPSGAQLVMQIQLASNEGPDICHFPAGGVG